MPFLIFAANEASQFSLFSIFGRTVMPHLQQRLKMA
jgi:hypothetical protein